LTVRKLAAWNQSLMGAAEMPQTLPLRYVKLQDALPTGEALVWRALR
jgi:hypothetical protein